MPLRGGAGAVDRRAERGETKVSLKSAARFFVRSPWGAVILVVAVALVVRVAFALGYVGIDRIKHAPVESISADQPIEDVIDQDGYTILGRQMISGNPYTDTIRQPLYPALHALVFLTLGDHPTLLYNRLANALVAALGCGAIYLLARRMFGTTVGLVAGLLAAITINLIHKSGYILSEILAVPLLTLALYFFLGFADERRWRQLLLGAFMFGLATLTRPTTYLMIYLLPFWLWVAYGRINGPMLGRSAVLVLVVLAVISPWAVHNYRMTGRLMPVSSRPYTLLCGCYGPGQFEQPLGNNKGQWMPIRECGLFSPEQLEQLDGMGAYETEAKCKERFFEYIPTAWSRVPELMWYRALTFLALYRSPGRSGPFYLVYHGQQVVLFLLFLGGLWISRAHWRRFSILYLAYLFLGVFMILVFYGGSRNRLYVEPIIIAFAAAYLVWLVERFVLRRTAAQKGAHT